LSPDLTKGLRFTEGQIIGVLREAEAGAKTADLARKHGVSKATLYNWKAKYGGLEVSEVKRLRVLEDENGLLKHFQALLDVNERRAFKVIAADRSVIRCQSHRNREMALFRCSSYRYFERKWYGPPIYLIDLDHAVIVGGEAATAIPQADVAPPKLRKGFSLANKIEQSTRLGSGRLRSSRLEHEGSI
jgi:putative transposase